MSTKTKFITILFIFGVIFYFIASSLLYMWSDTFERITFENSFQVKVTSTYNSRGSTYVWGENNKYLIPLARDLRQKTLFPRIKKGDILKKEKNSTKIILIKEEQEFYFYFRKKEEPNPNKWLRGSLK